MRSSCNWFSERATKTWKAHAGRSFLLLVPQGCDDERVIELVTAWCSSNFIPPSDFAGHQLALVRLISDTQVTSRQFAIRLSSAIERQCQIFLPVDPDDYPSDIIQNAIEGALAHGRYPVLAIGRFHAFASIDDGAMQSVLSQLRTLEMDRKMTTLAFSPLTYDALRRSMDGSKAFLNSVYGDAHDQVAISPISREEFVTHAIQLGSSPPDAQRAYRLGGGPDRIFQILAEAVAYGQKDLISYCVTRCDATIAAFFERTVHGSGDPGRNLLGALSVGCLLVPEDAYLRANPLMHFFARIDEGGSLRCSTPVFSRWILSKRAGPWSAYGNCLTLLRSRDFEGAKEVARSLIGTDHRQVAFPALAYLFSALAVDLRHSFFGVDWIAVDDAKSIAVKNLGSIPSAYVAWVNIAARWSDKINALRSKSRLQSDALALGSSDYDTRQLLLYLVTRYLKAVETSGSSLLESLAKIPEILLQMFAVAYCGIDFTDCPPDLEDLDYQEFFAGLGAFDLPSKGTRISLTSLIVIVPAMLKKNPLLADSSLVDPKRIRSLQGSLIGNIRNPSAHAVIEWSEKDRSALKSVCLEWLFAWLKLEGVDRPSGITGIVEAPTIDDLEALLTQGDSVARECLYDG